MDRSKIVAIITGAIAILLSVAYLLIVQFLDSRGAMVPAPIDVSYHLLTSGTLLTSGMLLTSGVPHLM